MTRNLIAFNVTLRTLPNILVKYDTLYIGMHRIPSIVGSYLWGDLVQQCTSKGC